MHLGIWEIALILVIVLVLFGAGKLPQVMGDVARGVKSFRAGLREDEAAPVSSSSSTPVEPIPVASQPAVTVSSVAGVVSSSPEHGGKPA
jgi:sec-independent protein translocase protein TatA